MNGLVNRIRQLQDLGQKVWLDEPLGSALLGGKLGRLIEEDGVSGVCCDPCLPGGNFADHKAEKKTVRERAPASDPAHQAPDGPALHIARETADALHRTFRNSQAYDGFVTVAISLAAASTDAAEMIAEAHRLRDVLGRTNVLIQVPATREGLTAIRQLTVEGISVSAALIFGVSRYREVLDAYLTGLEDRRSRGESLDGIISIARLAVDPINAMVDEQLRSLTARSQEQRNRALLGKAGVQVARFAYQIYKKTLASPRWAALAAHGARPQRLLFADSCAAGRTGGGVKHVDQLIGRDSIIALTLETLSAYRVHGNPTPSLESSPYEVATFLVDLSEAGIDLERVSQQLQVEHARHLAEHKPRTDRRVAEISNLMA